MGRFNEIKSGSKSLLNAMSISTQSLPPAQARLAALNRLKAKDKFGRTEQSTKAGSSREGAQQGPQYVNKQTLAPESTRNMVQQQKQDDSQPLKPNRSLGKYFEYDLSKLHNSRGGFLTEEDGEDGKIKSVIEMARERERDRQKMREGEDPGEWNNSQSEGRR